MPKKSVKKERKNYNRGTIYIGSIILVALLLLGFFLYSHYTKNASLELESASYAARSGGSNLSAPVIIEGEDISTYSISGGVQVIDDIEASGNKALMLSINTDVSSQVTLPQSSGSLTIMAKGERCKGNPEVVVLVNEKQVVKKNISSSEWNDYTVQVPLAAGTHNVKIVFPNDLSSTSGNICDRSLKIDQLIFQ